MADFGRLGPVAGSEVAVTTGSTISLYVTSDRNVNHELTIELSPDGGTSWYPSGRAIIGDGVLTITAATTSVRASVLRSEDRSTGEVLIVVR